MKYLNLFFFKKAQLWVRSGKFKEWYTKNRSEKSLFFNEIPLENTVTKFPLDYVEREENQTRLTQGLKDRKEYTVFFSLNYFDLSANVILSIVFPGLSHLTETFIKCNSAEFSQLKLKQFLNILS